MLFTKKYGPKTLGDFLGNTEQRERIRQWILNILSNKKKKPLLIYGPPGVGKTTIAYALQNEFDLELLEMSASDFRNKAQIERVLASASASGSLFGKRKILLIDDVDALQGTDRGGAGAITAILRENRYPIILTATDPWEKKLAPIRVECELLDMKRVSTQSIKKMLIQVAAQEKITITDTKLSAIAENADGDVRSALNDLQAQNTYARDRQKDIFQRIRTVFKARTYREAKEATLGDVDYDILKLWVDENIPNEYEAAEDLACAYHMLSRADLFEGRIKKQKWVYLKYAFDLATAGVGLAKKKPYAKFTKYQFPKYLKEMSRTVQRRALLKAIGEKVGKLTHVNRRDARQYLPLIRAFAEQSPQETLDLYNFTEEELAFIVGTSVKGLKTAKK